MPRIHLIFDCIIFLSIIFSVVIAIFLYRKIKKNTAKKIHKLFLFITIVFCTTIIYGSFIEPNIIVQKHEALDLPNVEIEFTFALIADFQVGPYKRDEFVQRTVNKILKEKPDFVLIAGDLIDNNGSTLDEFSYLEPLKQVAEQIPTYAVSGNHEIGAMGPGENGKVFEDKGEQTKQTSEDFGITYLVNQLALFEKENQKVYIFGLDDWWSDDIDFSSLVLREQNIPTIVMNHNPAAIRKAAEFPIDFFVAGHTHGGQVRLPFIGALLRSEKSIPRSWDKGWFEYNGIKAFTTSGLGESVTRARLFNPPEIIYFHVK